MPVSVSPAVRAGLLAGALLYVHALLPNSHAYPLLWPVAGGALAVAWSLRRARTPIGIGRALREGVVGGGVAALLDVVGLVPTYLFLTTAAGAPLARQLGGAGPIPYAPGTLLALTLAMLFAVPAAVIGSALARALARPLSRLA